MRDSNEYLVSVVVPNYNNQDYIEKCIKSIFDQSYTGVYEVIIVDDCSTDNSVRIIQDLMKVYSRLKLIPLKKNGGVSNARNEGLFSVKTKYVTFIDSDDYYFNKEKLKNEMELIKKYRTKIGKEILSYSSVVKAQNDLSRYYFPPSNKKMYLQGNVEVNLLKGRKFKTIMRDYCLSTEIVRSVGGYNPNRNLYEDWELLLKLSSIVEFYCTFEYGTAYRVSINGLSQRPISLLNKKKNEIFYEFLNSKNVWVRAEILLVKKLVDFNSSLKRKYYLFKKFVKGVLLKTGLYSINHNN
ncbi:glycosyltransferase family 2 protein [Fictibacillus enclensis]|uniref:glycosyltransferase family 2 protein n=1 Tax=Fictibacillus enclensis TaxID=1017270 RepID=UPI0024BF31E6|nr:glycosyltransferase family 2 protein [Fictibacillus enclensis]WHY71988.1 glycosyltransferase family 2 protein [Fictibacillus enclensis]